MDFVRLKYKIGRLMKSDEKALVNINLELLNGYRGRFLDVGCGMGDNIKPILDMNKPFEIYGLDIYEPDLQAAHEKKLSAHFWVSDALNMSLRANVFDVVLSNQVIEHIVIEYFWKKFIVF